MEPNQKMDPKLAVQLERLRAVPPRDPQRAAASRKAFLAEAEQMIAQGVTLKEKRRLIGWNNAIQALFGYRRKERSMMLSTITSIIVILGLILGGGGVTVAAAQSSLPDQTLYPVKLWSEEMRADLAADPQTQFDLALQFADRRAGEIQSVIQAGGLPPEPVINRLQNQVENALQIAAKQGDGMGMQLIEQACDRLRQQDRLMEHLQSRSNPEAAPTLAHLRQMIRERLAWAEEGMNDPARLQERLHKRDGSGQGVSPASSPSPAGGQQKGSPAAPAGGQGGNPWTEGTPTPGSGYGPGPGPDATCTPGSSYGPNPNSPSQPGGPGGNGGGKGNENGKR